MFRRLLFLFTLVCAAFSVAQAANTLENPGTGKLPFIQGYYVRVEANGDTTLIIALREFTVFEKLKFKNKKEQEKYDRLTRNVKITLPYAKLIAETLVETYEYIETLPTEKDREAYLKQFEKAIFDQYKPVLRRFSKTQAKILIKLIQRETHQSSYNIVKAFMGTARATFWQGFGKLFGVSLKGRYEPKKNAEDAMIERIACQIEQGIL